eukprot:6458141-Amphidinium_carterae.1
MVLLPPSSVDAVAVGYFLFCIHSCCRFSDGLKLSSEPVVEGRFFEATTEFHKTAKVRNSGRRMLPLVGLSEGVSAVPWCEAWLRAREQQGLKASPVEPTLPAPAAGGGWSKGRLSTGEATVWLLDLLRRFSTSPIGGSPMGTHSMKATVLSWLAKAGASDHSRRMMGKHSKGKDQSMIIYSRDAMAKPLMEVEKVYSQIREGIFRPDTDRSGYWQHARGAAEVSAQSLEEIAA